MNSIMEGLNTSGKLKVVLAAKGDDAGDLAELLDVTRETINNRMEANKWMVDDLKKIAAKYQIEVTDLI